jgi:hypothetical protein
MESLVFFTALCLETRILQSITVRSLLTYVLCENVSKIRGCEEHKKRKSIQEYLLLDTFLLLCT